VLLAGVAVVATGMGAGAATATPGAGAARPDSYGGDSAAASIQFQVDKQPFPFPVNDPFHTWVPFASTSIDSSGGAEAIASSVYPGQGVLGVPALICVFAPICDKLPGGGFPKYPDWAHAQYPSHKDDSATLSQKPFPGTGPFEVRPNSVEAHADTSRVEATTITSGAGLTGVVTVQDATTHSIQKFEGSTLVLTAETVLKGVNIGGVVHIDQITSLATAKIDGSKVGTSSANTTVSGATVAGQGVTIDSTGIHAGPGGDNGVLKKTLNDALKSLADKGISVRSLGDNKSAKPSKVVAETGGMLVIAKQEVNAPALPGVGETGNGTYTVTATLGGAGINAFASPANPLPDVGVDVPTPTTPTGSVPAPTTPGTTGTTPTVATDTEEPAQQPAQVAGAAPKPAALGTDLTNKKLKTLALVLLGYPLLILLGAPLRAPSRLPRIR